MRHFILLGAFLAATASATPTVVSISGAVRLADGASPSAVTISLLFDLDNNGTFSAFEQSSSTTDADGNFSVEFKPDLSKVSFAELTAISALVQKVEDGGFEALVSDAPRVLVVRFAKAGYAPAVRRLSALGIATAFDVVLQPLTPMACGNSVCVTPGGGVELSGLTRAMNLGSASARAFAPVTDSAAFPGVYAEKNGAALVTSGFFDMQLTDASGAPLTTLAAPVSLRQLVAPEALPTLIDATAGTSGVEISMYSLDATTGIWTSEGNGTLQAADGTAIKESELAAVKAGTYGDDVFVAFSAAHMSFWNIDRAMNDLACVRGRAVNDEGLPLAGAFVEVAGISYMSHGIGLTIGADGVFAGNVVRSESATEDVNGDGVKGDTFQVHAVATLNGETYVSAAIDTPLVKSSTSANSESLKCLPAECDCVDMGDVTLSKLAPRMCKLTISASVSGTLPRHGVAPVGGPASGDPASGVAVGANAKLGYLDLSGPSFRSLCSSAATCMGGTTGADGKVTIEVPIAGETPTLSASVSTFTEDENGDSVFISGSVEVDGCVDGAASASMSLKYGRYTNFSSFVKALPVPTPAGGGAAGGGGASGNGDGDSDGCGCSSSVRAKPELAGFLLFLPACMAFRRRRD